MVGLGDWTYSVVSAAALVYREDADTNLLSPGRFYAAVVLKLTVARFLVDYDCELQPFRGDRSVQWRSTIVPKSSIELAVRPRNTACDAPM
jgi:hypothetical protein